jgi:hypothetical protein
MRSIRLALACSLSFALCASPLAVHADRLCSGTRLPEKIESLGVPLVLNGMGVRRATFLKVHVYVAGLYVPAATRDSAAILNPANPKQITMRFVRNVSRGDMLSTLRDSLKDNAGAALGDNAAHMQNLERILPNLRDGMVLTLAYRPKYGLHVFADNRLIGVERDDTFANLLFQVWLGPKPPDGDLKQGLLGKPCS